MFSQDQEVLSSAANTGTIVRKDIHEDSDELKAALNRILTRPSGINKMIGTLFLV